MVFFVGNVFDVFYLKATLSAVLGEPSSEEAQ